MQTCYVSDYCCKDTSVKSSEEHFTSDEINEKCDLLCSEDNEHYNELSCIKGTFDDEIVYYLDKADQDKSDFDDLSANNSLNPCSAAPGCTRIAETHPTAAHRGKKIFLYFFSKCLMERILICL